MQLEWLSIYYHMYDGMNVLTVDMKIWLNWGNEPVRVNRVAQSRNLLANY
jgi:hypothetical protein